MELAFSATDVEWHEDDCGMACAFVSGEHYLTFSKRAGVGATPSVLVMECDHLAPLGVDAIRTCTFGQSGLVVDLFGPIEGITVIKVKFILSPVVLGLACAALPRLFCDNKRVLRFAKD